MNYIFNIENSEVGRIRFINYISKLRIASKDNYIILGNDQYIKEKAILSETDRVIIQRGLFDECVKYIKWLNKNFPKIKIIYDIDDWLLGIGIPEYNIAHWRLRKNYEKIKSNIYEIAKYADRIVVSSDWLFKQFKELAGKKVKKFENCIPEAYLPETKPKTLGKKLKVIYTGSLNHYLTKNKHLDILRDNNIEGIKPHDMLGDFAQYINPLIHAIKTDLIDFYIFSKDGWLLSAFDEVKNKINIVPCCEYSLYYKKITEINPDVQLNLLTFNHFNQAKSQLKWWEAIALGIIPLSTDFIGTKSPYHELPFDDLKIKDDGSDLLEKFKYCRDFYNFIQKDLAYLKEKQLSKLLLENNYENFKEIYLR